MGACAEQGPAFDSQELDALQFDIEEMLLGRIFDAAFRIARSGACVVGADRFAGSQEFPDSTGVPYRLHYAFDGRRLTLELQYHEYEESARAAHPLHECA